MPRPEHGKAAAPRLLLSSCAAVNWKRPEASQRSNRIAEGQRSASAAPPVSTVGKRGSGLPCRVCTLPPVSEIVVDPIPVAKGNNGIPGCRVLRLPPHEFQGCAVGKWSRASGWVPVERPRVPLECGAVPRVGYQLGQGRVQRRCLRIVPCGRSSGERSSIHQSRSGVGGRQESKARSCATGPGSRDGTLQVSRAGNAGKKPDNEIQYRLPTTDCARVCSPGAEIVHRISLQPPVKRRPGHRSQAVRCTGAVPNTSRPPRAFYRRHSPRVSTRRARRSSSSLARRRLMPASSRCRQPICSLRSSPLSGVVS